MKVQQRFGGAPWRGRRTAPVGVGPVESRQERYRTLALVTVERRFLVLLSMMRRVGGWFYVLRKSPTRGR